MALDDLFDEGQNKPDSEKPQKAEGQNVPNETAPKEPEEGETGKNEDELDAIAESTRSTKPSTNVGTKKKRSKAKPRMGIPWERKQELGLWETWLHMIKMIILPDDYLYDGYKLDTQKADQFFKEGLITLLIVTIIADLIISACGLLLTSIINPLQIILIPLILIAQAAFELVIIPLLMLISLFIVTWLINLLFKIIYKISLNFKDTLRVTTYTIVPFAVAINIVRIPIMIISFIPCINIVFSLLFLVISVTALVLQIRFFGIAMEKIYGIEAKKGWIVYGSTFAILVIIGITIFIILTMLGIGCNVILSILTLLLGALSAGGGGQ